MQKLYCYVDETGQDTEGSFFLVSVVIATDDENERLLQELVEIERSVGKRRDRWAQNTIDVRLAYLERVFDRLPLEHGAFYASFTNTTEYIALTAHTVARSIRAVAHKDYRATIEIDGFNAAELSATRKILKSEHIRYNRLRGARDQSSALLRLADALAGFIRDHEEGQQYTRALFNRLQKKGQLHRLS